MTKGGSADTSLAFENTYDPADFTYSIDFSKVLTGRDWLDTDKFTIEVYQTDSDYVVSGDAKASQDVKKDTTDHKGTLNVTINEPGTYYYVVKEANGGTTINGVAYDAVEYHIEVTLVDNLDGKMVVSNEVITLNGELVEAIEFDNIYSAELGTVVLEATKTVESVPEIQYVLQDREFTFELYETDSEFAINGNPIQIVKNAADGSVTFEAIEYVEETTRYYVMKEVVEYKAGIVYDTNEYHITVIVEDNLEGALVPTVTITKNGKAVDVDEVEFINEYNPYPGEITIGAEKVLDGRSLEAEEFSFVITDQAGKVVADGKNDANGLIEFDTLSFDKAGTYEFTVSEVKGNEGGVTYDATEYDITINVTDGGEGYLIAELDTGTPELVFENTYGAFPAKVTLEAKKELDGRKLKADEFSFVLKNAEGKQVGKLATNTVKGDITFEEMIFEKAGTYTYTISEVKGTDEEITYTDKVIKVTITVIDNLEGELVPTVEYSEAKVVFTNIYTEKLTQDTGDHNQIGLYTVVFGVAAISLFTMIIEKKKKEQE